MRIIIAILFCSLLTISAQIPPRTMEDLLLTVRTPTATSSAWYPTNVGTPIAWWRVDDVAGTPIPTTDNSGIITNWAEPVTGYVLTNTGSTHKGPFLTNNVLNGHAAAYFNASEGKFLCCNNYSASPGRETWIVVNVNTNNPDTIILDGKSSSNREFLYNRYDLALNYNNLVDTYFYTTNGNKWTVLTLVADSSPRGRILYNNNVVQSGNSSRTADGLTMGVRYSQDQSWSECYIAELISYSATNSAANQSNIFWYFTNKYGSM